MANSYVVNSGLTSVAASITKVAIQLATGTTVSNAIIAFDISFDSVATGAGAVPIKVALVRETGASSGGAAGTINVAEDVNGRAANTTARVNDTTDGTGPIILAGWLVAPTGLFSYQFPLGRQIRMKVSDFLALRLVTQAGMTTVNYDSNLWFEE